MDGSKEHAPNTQTEENVQIEKKVQNEETTPNAQTEELKEPGTIEKRQSKLTEKALLAKISDLEQKRKCYLNKAASLKDTIKTLIESGDDSDLEGNFNKYGLLIFDAKKAHNALLELLPVEEREKHEIWFKAKLLNVNEFSHNIKERLKLKQERDGITVNLDKDDEIQPSDSASNTKSRLSTRSKGSRASIEAARVQAEAKKAALLERAAALKRRQELEDQAELLRKQMEQMDLDGEIKAADAELEVLQTFADGDGMSSYVRKQRPKETGVSSEPYVLMPANVVGPGAIPKQRTPAVDNNYLLGTRAKPNTTAKTDNVASRPTIDDSPLQILQRQNEISRLLMEQQRASQLPPREIPVFDGDPLKFKMFMQAFKHCVEDKCTTKGDCMYFLERYTRGRPRDLVQSCLHMDAGRGFEAAKSLLQEHFGDETMITAAYMQKFSQWPAVRAENVTLLQDYALFLRGCNNAMADLPDMKELDMAANLRVVISKLPFKLRERFRTVACDIRERQKRKPNFGDVVKFVEHQYKLLSDPIFGDILATEKRDVPIRRDGPKKDGYVTHPKLKKENFATNVCDVKEPQHKEKKATEKYEGMSKSNCLFCSQGHLLGECKQFIKNKHSEKVNFLKEKGVCFGCLSTGHLSRNCEKRMICDKCKMKHPTALHINFKTKVDKAVGTSEPGSTVNSALVSAQTFGSQTGAGSNGMLPILPVQVKARKGNKVIQTYAFLDSGSTSTFCSEALMRRLNLTGKRSKICLLTMSPKTTVSTYIVDELEISGLNGERYYALPNVYTQKTIPATTASIIKSETIKKWPYLDHIVIPEIQAEVELLIGTNASKLLEPWEVVNSQGEGPFATKTLLGWVVSGKNEDGQSDVGEDGCHVANMNRISVESLELLLEKQYEHDFSEKAAEDKDEMSREETKFIDIMEQSVTLQEGHYSLKLPFRNKDVRMPNNRCVAQQRLTGIKRKMERDEKFHQDYTAFLEDVIRNGYAEMVPEDELRDGDENVFYIPHHGVYHPRKGKLRVVFDCGAKFKGTSLNDELLQGPNLTSSLIGVLLRFRQEPIAFMSDIKSMFYQVQVAKEDRDFLRFLWWTNGDLTKKAVEYRMTVHLFGAVSSPSCASYALRKTADDHRSSFEEDVVDTVHNNFYVDDCLKSSPSVEEAVQTVKYLTDLCKKGGFCLTQWVSNRREVLQTIPEQEHSKNVRTLNLDRDHLPMERALGLQWCMESDTFNFRMDCKEKRPTRRGILSVVSSVYDPLGYIAAVTLPAKHILQELCRQNCGWDEEIPQILHQKWINWLTDLKGLSTFHVSRCLKPHDFGPPVHAQLHHFADASEIGYGTVTYLRIQNEVDDVHVSFLLGKSRVTPLKPVTIPRLELTAAVLAVRVDKMVKAELQLQLEESCFWTDSSTVLKYINNENKRFKTFVANRVAAIRKETDTAQWKYIHTSQNPADDASRGLTVHKLLDSKTWLTGPEFLWEAKETWRHCRMESNLDDGDPEVKRDPEVKKNISVHTISVQNSSATNQLIMYYSDWRRLKTAVAWMLRLKSTLLKLSRRRKQLMLAAPVDLDQINREMVKARGAKGHKLSSDDLSMAERAILQFCQKDRFNSEMCALLSGKRVKRSSPIYKLDPVMEEGFLRVGGRLSRTAMPEERKRPIILAKDQHVSVLILRNIHEQLRHGGRNFILSKLREKYWITHANSAARKILSKCVFCKRHKGKLCDQKMADLPRERTTPDLPPFTHVGVDYFGPIEVKQGRSYVKRYGVIFSCMTSRAVHLEVAHSLDTGSCISAIRRFICRRGPVSTFRSDNGTNFRGAEKELKTSIAELNNGKIEKSLIHEDIQWSFNPPAASHHGGAWESMIRLVRRVLVSVLQQQVLTDEALVTVLCEAEAVLNDRPITRLSEDPNDLEPLTPNHLLTLKRKPILPPGLFDENDQYAKRRWKQAQYIADLFWKRWSKEYLAGLQERQKWNDTKRNLATGDIVLIADATAPRNSWIIGKVIKTFPDRSDVVRSVQIQTKTNIIERPVTKLCCILEADQ